MITQRELSVIQWIEKCQANGAHSFAVASVQKELPCHTAVAIKSALSRLTAKGKIVSLHKGYYLILPPQFRSKGILPPYLFLDAFMCHLQRPYYLALLNAAAFHGASHQQPQEHFVMTNFPVLRPTQKKGLKINYVSIKEIPFSLIEKRKTEAGYLNISNVALTAADLIQFERRVGGLNRASTVLNELAEVIRPLDFSPVLLQHVHATTLQRLGFILENVCHNMELADGLFEAMKMQKLKLYRIPLKTSQETKGFSSDNRWKIIVNTEIETDV